MFRQHDTRDYSTVNIILGDSEDSEHEGVQCPLDFLPRVGDEIECFSHRDERGNYMNEGAGPAAAMKFRTVLRGRVTRVEHLIEERGRNSREHQWAQHVNVYCEPIK